mmetsp:Transcript_6586/g.19434  ORF Transcript_6586/g.19434 Transcript_6586/m.19434 type:complete len:103 (-) Transcript_6586:251-559(-)
MTPMDPPAKPAAPSMNNRENSRPPAHGRQSVGRGLRSVAGAGGAAGGAGAVFCARWGPDGIRAAHEAAKRAHRINLGERGAVIAIRIWAGDRLLGDFLYRGE